MSRISLLPVFLFVLATGAAQDPAKPVASSSASAGDREPGQSLQAAFPVHTLDFKTVDAPPGLTVSSVMTFPTECTSDGSLFFDMLDSKNLKMHTLVSVHGKDSKTYQVSAISDLNDVSIISIFPSDDTVGVLVRASKEKPGQPLPGRSPAGIAWRDYHNFIAEFDRDGQYKEAIQLPMEYSLSHFAILPPGEFLVTGYDKLNSTVRLLVLKQSGEVLRSLDLPSAREFAAANASADSADSDKAARQLLGSILFTPYKNDILVWRMNSGDSILDVGAGGYVREVSLRPPQGEVFVDLVAASDRWLAHFRIESTRENAAYSQSAYSYYELNPQDGSIVSKLVQTGEAPTAISCESGGRYIAFRRDQDSKLILLGAE